MTDQENIENLKKQIKELTERLENANETIARLVNSGRFVLNQDTENK